MQNKLLKEDWRKNMNVIQKIKIEILALTISVFIKSVLGSIITTSTIIVAYQLLLNHYIFLAPYRWYFYTLAVAISIWSFIFIRDRFFYRPVFPRLYPDYRILEKDILYEYKDRMHMIYRKRLKLKALKDNLKSFDHRYRWTGKGTIKVHLSHPKQKYIETFQKGLFQYYSVLFERTLKKKETFDLEIIFELEDIEGKARTFLSTLIEEPTDYLSLKVKLPYSFKINEAVYEICTHMGAKNPIDTNNIPFINGVAELEIYKPKLLYYYEISWPDTPSKIN
ncbi:MAG TPA: hypothetical protein PK728_04445 [Bacillota bacterium]|nr:hypothetical protein [Bacillota bacterium]